MKEKTLISDQSGHCGRSSCLTCTNCRAINFEERRSEFASTPLQLYAKEVENYFFYYAGRIKQNQ